MKFNSRKYYENLQAVGFSENQSQVIVEGFHEHVSYEDVAKKVDIINLDKKIDIVEMKLEKSMANLATRLTTFICITSFSLMAILLSFMAFLHSSK
jgi:hypothetical protein